MKSIEAISGNWGGFYHLPGSSNYQILLHLYVKKNFIYGKV